MRTRQSPRSSRREPATDSPGFRADAAASNRNSTDHAILMAQSERGWRWQVIDLNGVLVARGLSADQRDAMDCAQRAIGVSA